MEHISSIELKHIIFYSFSIVTIYYIVSLLNLQFWIKTTLALPALYIAPGMLLYMLICRNEENRCIVSIIVWSFFLSTILVVLITSVFLYFCVPLTVSIMNTFFLLFVTVIGVLLIFYHIKGNIIVHTVQYTRTDLLILTTVFTGYLLILYLYFLLPYRMGGDEFGYIDSARYAILKSELYSPYADPLASTFKNLIAGRLFWILLTASYITSTNIHPSYAPIMSSMFLPMTALAALLLISEDFKKDVPLKIFVVLTVLTNPLLLSYGRTLLPDVALAFYSTFAFHLFIKSFRYDSSGKILINTLHFLYSMIVSLIAIMIKPNFVILLAIIMTFTIFIIQYRKRLKNKLILYLTLIPLVIYIATDAIYVLLYYILNYEPLHLISSFILFSPSAYFLRTLVPIAGSTPLFSYSLIDYVQYLYTLLSPEMLSPHVAITTLILPLVIWFILKRVNVQFKVYGTLVLITLTLIYVGGLTSGELYNILRYLLVMLPGLIVFSTLLTRAVLNNNPIRILNFYIGATFLLVMFHFSLVTNKRGIWLTYDLPKLPDYTFYLMLTLSFVVIFLLSLSVTKTKISVSIVILVLLTVLASNIYFSAFTIMNSSYTQDYDARMRDLSSTFEGGKVIVSNFYSWLLPFIPNNVVTDGFHLSLPRTEQEFLELMSILPNGTLLVFAQDPSYTWYDYSNNYISKYIPPANTQSDFIDPVVSLSFKNHSVIYKLPKDVDIGIYGPTLTEDGMNFDGNSYLYIPHLSAFDFADRISVECLLRAGTSQKYQVIVHGAQPFTPYDRSYILALNTVINEILWRLEGTNNPELRYKYKDLDGWIHLVATYDGSTARLFINGLEVKNISMAGNITNENGITIGVGNINPTYWFNGTIRELRIYNEALSANEVKVLYLRTLGYNLPVFVASRIFPRGTVSLYKVVSAVVWNHEHNVSIIIKDLKIFYTNITNVRLKMKVETDKAETLTLIVNTYRFSKVLKFKLSTGINILEFDFPTKDEKGKGYGLYIGGWSRVVALDSNGNIIYNSIVSPLTIMPGSLLLMIWILSLSGLLLIALSCNLIKKCRRLRIKSQDGLYIHRIL